MKHLVLTLWIVIFLGTSVLAGPEYVTGPICHAASGCWVDTKTGACPDCVMGRQEVTHTHEEEPEVTHTLEGTMTYWTYRQFFPNVSEQAFINFEKCAMTGVTEWAKRNEVGCEKYLKGRDWWLSTGMPLPEGM